MNCLLHIALVYTIAVYVPGTGLQVDDRDKAIQDLELERDNLYREINQAIDDSVRSLKESNDSHVLQGISYINSLKDQIARIKNNRTIETEVTDLVESNTMANRRRLITTPHFTLSTKKNFNNKSKKWKKRWKNRMIIQQKLEEWLAIREAEKQKIRNYKTAKLNSRYVIEKCPYFGIQKLNKKKKSGKKKKGGGRSLYPCCRKCCKKSYMGCL